MQRWPSIVALLALGCTDRRLVITAGPDDSLAIVALIHLDAVSKVSVCPLAGSTSRCELAIADDDSAAYWLLRSDQFIGADGSPADLSQLSASARSSLPPEGSCGRCLIPPTAAGLPLGGVQTIHPGDRCPIPAGGSPPKSWSVHDGTRDGVPAGIQDAVVLEVPGRCPFQASDKLNGSLCSLEPERIFPPWARPYWTGLASSGELTILTSSSALLVDSAGHRSIRPIEGEGSTGAVTPLPGGGLALIRALPDNINVPEAEVRMLNPSLDSTRFPPATLPTTAFAISTEWVDRTLVILGSGNRTGGLPTIFGCDLDSGQCVQISRSRFLPLSSNINGATRLADGLIWAWLSSTGAIAVFDGLPRVGEATGSGPPEEVGSRTSRGIIDGHVYVAGYLDDSFPAFDEVDAAQAVGDRIFVCTSSSNHSRGMIMTATLSRGRLADPAYDPRRELSLLQRVSPCGTFEAAPDRPDWIRYLSATASAAIDFDARSGSIMRQVDLRAAFSTLPRRARGVLTTSTGWIATVDDSGTIFRQAPAALPELIYGDREGRYGGGEKVVRWREDGFWAFGERIDPVHIDATSGQAQRVSLAGLSPTDSVRKGLVGSSTGQPIWLAGSDVDGHSWLGGLPLSGGPRSAAAVEKLPDFPSDAEVSALAELDPHTLIAGIAGQAELIAIDTRRGSITRLPSPAGFPPGVCETTQEGPWFALDGAGGLVLAAGCGGRLLCVSHGPGGAPIATACVALSIGGLDQVAVRVLSPDHLLVAPRELAGRRVFDLRYDGPLGRFVETIYPLTEQVDVFEMIGTSDQLLLAGDDGIQTIALSNHRLVEVPLGGPPSSTFSGAEAPDGTFVFGGVSGTLVRLRPGVPQPNCAQ